MSNRQAIPLADLSLLVIKLGRYKIEATDKWSFLPRAFCRCFAYFKTQPSNHSNHFKTF